LLTATHKADGGEGWWSIIRLKGEKRSVEPEKESCGIKGAVLKTDKTIGFRKWKRKSIGVFEDDCSI